VTKPLQLPAIAKIEQFVVSAAGIVGWHESSLTRQKSSPFLDIRSDVK
jgi:hypothetical protein